MNNLFLIDRIDCEDEAQADTPIEQLAGKFLDMADRGFALPTLCVRCAGKNDRGVIDSVSSMRGIDKLLQAGSPLGLHVHTEVDENGWKKWTHYAQPAKMRIQMERAFEVFRETFRVEPEFFGMGDQACSQDEVAAICGEFGVRMSIGDLDSAKYCEVTPERFQCKESTIIYDYRGMPWESDFPIFRHNLWWIPFGNDGVQGRDRSNCLSLLKGRDEKNYRPVLERYAKIAKQNPDKTVIIASLTHPPEVFSRWDMWGKMHEIAREYGYENITSTKAMKLLDK